MARITVEDCVDKVANRFDLVLLAAHRARALSKGAGITIEQDNDKPAVIALPDSILREATKPATDFRDRTILTLDRKAVSGFDIAADGTTLTWLTWFDHYFPQQLQVTQKKTGIACRTKLAPSDSQIYTTIRATGSQFDIAAADALWVPKMHHDGLTESFDLAEIAVDAPVETGVD